MEGGSDWVIEGRERRGKQGHGGGDGEADVDSDEHTTAKKSIKDIREHQIHHIG